MNPPSSCWRLLFPSHLPVSLRLSLSNGQVFSWRCQPHFLQEVVQPSPKEQQTPAVPPGAGSSFASLEIFEKLKTMRKQPERKIEDSLENKLENFEEEVWTGVLGDSVVRLRQRVLLGGPGELVLSPQ